jgi:long-subunit acyl-CoA synthetase (AMP-forming)
LGFSYVASLFSLNRGGRTVFTDIETIIKHNTIHSSSFSTLTVHDIEHCFLNNVLLETKINTIRVIGAELANHHRRYICANISNKVINSYSSNEFGQVGEVKDDGYCYICPKINVKIVDENFNNLPFGECGRIAIQSSQVINQYIDNKLNKNHFKDGFFISNDYGFLKSPSKLKVLGRVDNLLNIGSIKFASEPLEKEIEKNKDIKSCVVIADNIIFGIGIIIICIEQTENVSKLSFVEEINYKAINYFYGLNIKIKILEFEKFERTDTGKIIREKIINSIIDKKLI